MRYPASADTTSARKDIGIREFILLCACLTAVNALSIDTMLPALPNIARDLAIPHANDRQLIISVYLLGLGAGSLLFGMLSDQFGRKRVLGAAMAMFMLSLIICASAQTFVLLLAARTSAGFFAGASRVIVVGIVRDRFQGNAMAKIMSLIYSVFILIPVLAPSFGQVMLWIVPWRGIFWFLAVQSGAVMLWLLFRMPESLAPENRQRISPSTVFHTIGTIFHTRSSIGYMLASGAAMAMTVSFILSIQQILFDVFHAAAIFPFAYAAMAGGMGIGSLANSRLVSRFGARRLGQTALVIIILINIVHTGIILAGRETLFSFILLQSATMLITAFTGSNFSSISMEPFTKGAGTASSFQSFLTTALSATLGSLVGRAFSGSPLPLTAGLLIFALLSLAIVAWAERGRLFSRVHEGLLQKPEPVEVQ